MLQSVTSMVITVSKFTPGQMCMRLQYNCTTPKRHTLKLQVTSFASEMWSIIIINGLNLHKHIEHNILFFSKCSYILLFLFFRNIFSFTAHREEIHCVNEQRLPAIIIIKYILFLSFFVFFFHTFVENTSTLCCCVHASSTRGPNLGQTHLMKIFPFRGSFS